MTPADTIVAALRRSARELTSSRSILNLDEILDELVGAAVTTIPHIDAGGISMTENGVVTSRSPTNETITKLDRLQSELHEGPCVTAIKEPPEDGVVLARDLAGEDADRWPEFGQAAVAAGYPAILSVQMSAANAKVYAALNLYAREAGAFDAETRLTAGLFGVQAAMLLYGAGHVADLQRAVDSRDVIGQAKGILMERFTLDDDKAFQMLVRTSQNTNVKLADVAQFLRNEAGERHARLGAQLGEPS